MDAALLGSDKLSLRGMRVYRRQLVVDAVYMAALIITFIVLRNIGKFDILKIFHKKRRK